MAKQNKPPAAGRHRQARRRIRSVLGLVLALAVLAVGGVLLAAAAHRSPGIDPNPPSVQGPTVASRSPGEVTVADTMAPYTLALDRIGVTAPIVDATVQDGVLTPPNDVSMVGIWVDGAALDAEEGTTLLAGHVNLVGQGNGALFNLALMQPGDIVRTVDGQGRPTSWRVTSVVDRPKAEGVEESVLDGPSGPRRLAVVTCGGDLSYANGVGNYEDNVYLYADLVE